MNFHLVYTMAAGAVSCLYFGPDGQQAEAAYIEHRNDGDFDAVRWHTQIGLPYQHTTPARDNCVPGFKCRKAAAPDDSEAKAAEAKKAEEAEAKRIAAEAKKAEAAEAKRKAAEAKKAAAERK